MRIEISETPEGGPKVAWIQSTAESGATVGSRKTLWAMLVGIIAGLLLGISMGDPTMLFAGPVFGAFGALAWLGHEQKERGAPDPADAAPILANQYCEAEIFRTDDQLFLGWSLQGKRTQDEFTIPLAEATEIVVGSINDWFADKSWVTKFHESYVIVMPLRDGRVLRLADHAGRQAEVAELHSVLSQVLIAPRNKLLRDLETELRERDRHVGSDDIPDAY